MSVRDPGPGLYVSWVLVGGCLWVGGGDGVCEGGGGLESDKRNTAHNHLHSHALAQ
jgi:hypothetical protein